MRRTSAAKLLQPISQPIKLSKIPCARCGVLGVTVIVMQHTPNGWNERAWCGTECAREDGQPFVKKA